MGKRVKRRELLDQALADWHGAETSSPQVEQLSAETRDAILRRVQTNSAETPPMDVFAALFLPVRRIVLAGALPVLLLTVALGYVVLPLQQPLTESDSDTPSVRAMRVGNEVVFEIANGDRPHSIYKSNQPNDLAEGKPFVTTTGSFRDRLDNGADLVFYRID